MARSRRYLLFLLLLLGLSAGLTLAKLRESALQPARMAADQYYKVPSGAGLRATLGGLHEAGLLPHPRLFEAWLRLERWQQGRSLPTIRKGKYLIAAGSTPRDILALLEEGRVILEQFTIVEGWTFAQARAQLATLPTVRHHLADRDAAAAMAALGRPGMPPEGRLAPDTYRFAEDTPDTEILQQALGAQEKLLAAGWAGREPGLPLSSPDQALVLASIVEKETGLASERPLIAGVFVNRLRKGMRLQSDPTVIYGLGERYDGNIRTRDLREDTPFNTYTRAGLPPTPIALPGHDALQAVLHPAPTDALYFVALADGSGGHQFSATLEQHNAAVKRYLQRSRTTGGRP
jgi:UPF0755 protein